MRSLKTARRSGAASRKPSNRRTTPVSRGARGQSAFGRRRVRNDFISRFLRSALAGVRLKRPMLWLSACVLSLASAAALVAGGYVTDAERNVRNCFAEIAADAGFGVSSVHLAGNRRTDPNAILAALRIRPGQSIFTADVQGARARLLGMEWVAHAEVRRQYPDSIFVSIVEKVPFALWQAPDAALYVVERSGRRISAVSASEFPALPYLIGDGAPEAAAALIDAVARHRAVRARVRAMQRVSDRRWNLILDDGVIVELPEEGWAEELGVLEHLIVDKSVLERDISEIDLRARDDYFFVLRNGRKQQVIRGNAA